MGSIKESIRVKVFNKYNQRCAYCGQSIKQDNFSLDHITPKYRGYSNKDLARYNKSKGTDELENLNPCCKSCNSSKSTFTLEQWRNELSLKHERMMKYEGSYRLLMRFKIIKLANNNPIKFYFETL